MNQDNMIDTGNLKGVLNQRGRLGQAEKKARELLANTDASSPTAWAYAVTVLHTQLEQVWGIEADRFDVSWFLVDVMNEAGIPDKPEPGYSYDLTAPGVREARQNGLK